MVRSTNGGAGRLRHDDYPLLYPAITRQSAKLHQPATCAAGICRIRLRGNQSLRAEQRQRGEQKGASASDAVRNVTTFFLIRHASNDLFKHTLAGRTPGVHLNEVGKDEAEQLAAHLGREALDRIFTSPLERCMETAEPLAKKLNLKIEVSESLKEVNFGEWTGRKFAELDLLSEWKQWNVFRSGGRIPNGETMLEVQSRMVGLVQKLRREFPTGRIALVSHGDPLRSLLVYFLGMPSEFIRRLDLGPASVSVLCVNEWDAQVRCLNARFGAGWAGG